MDRGQTRKARPSSVAFWHGLLALGLVVTVACERRAAPDRPVRVYVSNEQGGDVAILDPEAGAVLGRIPVGKRPRGLRLLPDGRHLLVALSGSPIAGPGVDEAKLPPPDRSADGIGLVDLETKKLVRVFPSGDDPESFDLSPDGRTVYISNEETAEMSVLDRSTGRITGRVKVGVEPEGVTVRPDGRVVYVTCEADNAVVAVDTRSLAILARVPTAARPRSIVFSRDGRTAFVTAETGGAVTVIDAVSHTVVATIPISRSAGAPTPISRSAGAPTAARPMGSALSRDGRAVFVSNGRGQSVAILDVAGRRVARMIEGVGVRPWGIGTSPDGRKVYTANGPSNDVSVIDVSSGVVEKRIPVGRSPWGLAVDAR
jgi:YVTN family beta-propeller protein